MTDIKYTYMKETNLLPDGTNAILLTKETAMRLIRDLMEDLAGEPMVTGQAPNRPIFRTEDDRFFIFRVKNQQCGHLWPAHFRRGIDTRCTKPSGHEGEHETAFGIWRTDKEGGT